MASSPTYLGTVQDVQGATVSVVLDRDTVSGLAFIDGEGYRIGQIGSFVRISIGFTNLFGIVSQVGAGAVPESISDAQPHGHRWLKLQLVGEGRTGGSFERGVSQYPTIGDEAHLVTERDLASIYGRQDSARYARVGRLAGTEVVPTLVDLNQLVTRHSAVLGSTGSGKSTTVAQLLSVLSEPATYASARILVIDIHGEYAAALKDRATVFRLNADPDGGEMPLQIPYWALSFDEFLRVTPFGGVSDADRAALLQKLRELKAASLTTLPRDGVTADSMTVDSPIPFSIHRLWYDLHRSVCSTHTAQGQNQTPGTEAYVLDEYNEPMLGDIMGVRPPSYQPITAGGPNRVYLSQSGMNIRRQVNALESLLRDNRYDFLFRPGPWCPQATLEDPDIQPAADLDSLLAAWIGSEQPITILDLSGVPSSILMDLIGVVLRLVFDALFWSRARPEGGRARPLLIVMEEAHAYLSPQSAGYASEQARRVVKEGRKYGLGAMIVSQRPSEIDPTILSQCGTIFSLRLANASDRSHVTSVASDHLEGLFSMLPSLRTGEAIVVGEAVHLPSRTLIDTPPLHRRPDSHDPKVFDVEGQSGWNHPREPEEYGRVLEAWRSERLTNNLAEEREG